MDLKRQWTLDGLLVEWLLRAQRPFSYVGMVFDLLLLLLLAFAILLLFPTLVHGA
jgi:hypothetical protein